MFDSKSGNHLIKSERLNSTCMSIGHALWFIKYGICERFLYQNFNKETKHSPNFCGNPGQCHVRLLHLLPLPTLPQEGCSDALFKAVTEVLWSNSTAKTSATIVMSLPSSSIFKLPHLPKKVRYIHCSHSNISFRKAELGWLGRCRQLNFKFW